MCFWQNIKHQFFVTLNVVFHFFLSNVYTLYIEYCLVTLNSSARKAVFTHTNWMGELDGLPGSGEVEMRISLYI